MLNEEYLKYLNWIEHQNNEMQQLVEKWANINSGTDHLKGLESMLQELKRSFSVLNAEETEFSLPFFPRINLEGKPVFLPLGKALHLKKRPEAPLQILFVGHMDTVYGASHPFQKAEKIDTNLLKGPGVADMKGGLVILLKALEAFENFPHAEKIGWQILINSDEEVGSPGSANLLVRFAHTSHLGLLFEPALLGGELVSFRKGSANYSVVAQGKAAHIGRDPDQGRSAIQALAEFVIFIESLNHPLTGLVINVGTFQGGIANNIVPPFATCQLNIRGNDQKQMDEIENKMHAVLKEISQKKQVTLTLYPIIHRPPKPFDAKTHSLFQLLKTCGQDLGLDLKWHGTGGVCDGNILAAEGLPNIDTLGARGGNIHTVDEFIYLDSLTERCKLTALLLFKLAEDGHSFLGQL